MAAGASQLAMAYMTIRADQDDFRSDISNIKSYFLSQVRDMSVVAGGIFGAMGLAQIAGGIRGLVTAMISGGAQMEQYQVAMGVMLKDEQLALNTIKDIQAMAAKTPFNFPGLLQAWQQLKMYNIETSKILPMLRNLGDAASAAPQGMAYGLQRIMLAMGQIKALGRLQLQDFKQLINVGAASYEGVAKHLGMTAAEFTQAMSKRKISSKMAIDAIMAYVEERFGGMMDKQSRTFVGYLSTIQDYVSMFLTEAGKPLFELVKNNLGNIARWFDSKSAEVWKNRIVKALRTVISTVTAIVTNPMVQWVTQTALITAGVIATAVALKVGVLTSLHLIIGTVKKLLLMIGWLLTPMGAFVAAAALAVITFRQALQSSYGEQMRETLSECWTLLKEIGANLLDIWEQVKAGIDVALTKMLNWFGVATEGSAGAWAVIIDGLRDFLDWLSLMTTNWELTWELMKTKAGKWMLLMGDGWNEFIHNMKSRSIAFVEGMIAALQNLAGNWKKILEAMAINAMGPFKGVIKAIELYKEGASWQEIVAAAMMAATEGMRKMGDVAGEAGAAFGDAYQKEMDEHKYKTPGAINIASDALDARADAIKKQMAVEREEKRENRERARRKREESEFQDMIDDLVKTYRDPIEDQEEAAKEQAKQGKKAGIEGLTEYSKKIQEGLLGADEKKEEKEIAENTKKTEKNTAISADAARKMLEEGVNLKEPPVARAQ